MKTPMPATASLTREEYTALPGLSYSGLKELLRSPAHYRHWLANPKEETKALRIGKAVHAAFLTPDLWAKTYKAIPECDRRTKEGKEVHAAFMASLNPGDTALPFDEYEQSVNVAQAAERISDAKVVRTGAWVECPLVGADKRTPLKGIPDLIDAEGWIYDLKTTDDASERAALRTVLSYGYHLQAAHYIRLAHQHRNDIRGFRLIMVEKDAPHEGAIYEISGDLLELGVKETDRAYSLFDSCTASGEWPGYTGSVIRLDALPGAKPKSAGLSF